MRYFLTLMFVLLSTQLWAAENKQTYFCLSSSDNSQKLLVLADVDGEQVGYLDTNEYKLNDENGVLVGPSTAGSSFFKLASGKLDLMSSAGMWSGVCHQVTSENAQSLSNASKSSEVVATVESSTVASSASSNNKIKNMTDGSLCWKARHFKNNKYHWHTKNVELKYVKEAKARGLHCGVSTVSSSSSSSNDSSSYKKRERVLKETFNNLSYDLRISIQKYLKSKGFYNGSIDGKWGKKTLSGLKKELNKPYSSWNRYWLNKELRKMTTVTTSSSSSNTSTSSTSSSNSSNSPSNLSNSALCEKATFYINSNRRFFSGSTNRQYVKEAKARGLTCNVKSASSSSSSYEDCSSNPKSCKDNKSCVCSPNSPLGPTKLTDPPLTNATCIALIFLIPLAIELGSE